MYTDKDAALSQSDFDRGSAFVDSLKGWGSTYLGKCGYSFGSGNATVASLLKFATKHSAEGNPVWNAVAKVANA